MNWLETMVMCISLLLLFSGNLEVNPGPKGMISCPECKITSVINKRFAVVGMFLKTKFS